MFVYFYSKFSVPKTIWNRTESCIGITAFLKSFTKFIFLLQNGGRSDNSVSITTVNAVHKLVDSSCPNIILQNSVGETVQLSSAAFTADVGKKKKTCFWHLAKMGGGGEQRDHTHTKRIKVKILK